MKYKNILAVFLIIGAIVAIRAYTLYWGFIYDHFLVPPGGDAANHILVIKGFISQGRYFSLGGYPPGYHALMAFLSQSFNIDPVKLVTLTGPILAVLPIIATYIAAKKLLGQVAALFAAGLVGLGGTGIILGYGDGNYPNLLGSQFLMILGFGYLASALNGRLYQNLGIAGLLFILLAFFHHLSFTLFLAIFLVYWAGLIIIQRFEGDKIPRLKQFLVLSIFVIALAGVVGFIVFGRAAAIPGFWELVKGQPQPYFDRYLTTPLSLGQYPETVGGLIWVSGILGLVLILSGRSQVAWEKRWLIVCWIGTIFLLSRLSAAGLPGRFTRELTIPLAIAGGYLGQILVSQGRNLVNRLVIGGIFAVLIVLHTTMLITGPFQLPEGLKSMVWFWPEDKRRLDVINALPTGSVVAMPLASPFYEVLAKQSKVVFTADPTGANYIFIVNKTNPSPDPIAYPFFKGYDVSRKSLEEYPWAKQVIKLRDGSILKKVIHRG